MFRMTNEKQSLKAQRPIFVIETVTINNQLILKFIYEEINVLALDTFDVATSMVITMFNYNR
jgi:hypothetical protein